MKHIGEFFFPTETNLSSASWSSGKTKAIAAGLVVAALFALYFVFGTGPELPLWLYLLCLGYCFWTARCCFSWVRAFDRAETQARAEKLRAWDPPHQDESEKPENGKDDPS